MDRLPFDPSKMRQQQSARSDPAPQPRGPAVLTVSQLAGRIDVALRASLPPALRVIGEVTGFRDRTHWYFDLKDAESVISCVMFQSAARRSALVLENGLEVVLTGRIDYYAKQGKVSFIADKVEPVGAGAIDLAFKKLCDELRALGWFAPERKRRLPAFPRRVAVITSRSAAALQDVLVTMRRRCPAVEILLVDVRVQGEGASREVARALREVSRRAAELRVDAVIVTRGGGSKEDLWTFNEREVAAEILACAVPVVAAIGHETDVTIAELVADERCATPTQAAMRLTPDGADLCRQVDSIEARLRHGLRRLVRERDRGFAQTGRHVLQAIRMRHREAEMHLARLSARLERHRPAALHARRAAAIEAAEARLASAMRRRVAEVDLADVRRLLEQARARALRLAGQRLDAAERQLRAVGPMSVLERGFSYTTLEDGRLLRSAAQAASGEAIITRLADGQVRSVVDPAAASSNVARPARAEPDSVPAPPSAPPRRGRRPRPAGGDEPGLFSGG